MKRLENETDEEFENRKTKRMVRIYVGVALVSMSLGMFAYTLITIFNGHNRYVRYDLDQEKQEEQVDEALVLKKVL